MTPPGQGEKGALDTSYKDQCCKWGKATKQQRKRRDGERVKLSLRARQRGRESSEKQLFMSRRACEKTRKVSTRLREKSRPVSSPGLHRSGKLRVTMKRREAELGKNHGWKRVAAE